MGEFATQLLEDVGYTTMLAGNAAEALGALGQASHRSRRSVSGGLRSGRIIADRRG